MNGTHCKWEEGKWFGSHDLGAASLRPGGMGLGFGFGETNVKEPWTYLLGNYRVRTKTRMLRGFQDGNSPQRREGVGAMSAGNTKKFKGKSLWGYRRHDLGTTPLHS